MNHPYFSTTLSVTLGIITQDRSLGVVGGGRATIHQLANRGQRRSNYCRTFGDNLIPQHKLDTYAIDTRKLASLSHFLPLAILADSSSRLICNGSFRNILFLTRPISRSISAETQVTTAASDVFFIQARARAHPRTLLNCGHREICNLAQPFRSIHTSHVYLSHAKLFYEFLCRFNIYKLSNFPPRSSFSGNKLVFALESSVLCDERDINTEIMQVYAARLIVQFLLNE